MDYEMKMMDREIYGREIGEKIATRAGVNKLIIAMMDASLDDTVVLNAAKKQHGQYFSDEELKQFIAEAKNDSLQEA